MVASTVDCSLGAELNTDDRCPRAQGLRLLADLGATLEETYKQAAVITHTARAKGLKLNARAEVNSSRRSQTADSA